MSTLQRNQFITNLLQDPYRNATKAAINAGYSVKTAPTQASRLLKNEYVIDKLEKAAIAVQEQTKIDHSWVINELVGIVEQGRVAVQVLTKDGEPTGEYIANLPAANKALELLGKHLRMFPEGAGVTVNNDNRQVILRVVYDDDGNTNTFTLDGSPSQPTGIDPAPGETEDSPLR